MSEERRELQTQSAAAPAEMPWVTSWRYATGKLFRPFNPWHWLGTLGGVVAIDQLFGVDTENAVLGGAVFLLLMQAQEFVTNFLKGPPASPPPDDEKELTSLPRTKE